MDDLIVAKGGQTAIFDEGLRWRTENHHVNPPHITYTDKQEFPLYIEAVVEKWGFSRINHQRKR
jgi:hypothetical protein